ncbi:MAG: conserved membrane protein of unknown function [Promethearchaeota archaeon]|jgi:hypothetical protein|nr:MAG: conserved membrane protein of unknown function [Candidatus Lokiarchaeota archaeon]
MELQGYEYTDRQVKVATGFYIAIVASFIVTVFGAIYTFADLIAPTGKLDAFLQLNLGYQIAIVAGFSAGLFFLLIFFFGLYKRGTKSILKSIFKVRHLEEKYKNRLEIKLAAWGLLVSMSAVIVGLVIAIFQDLFFNVETSILWQLIANFSIGMTVLSIGIMMFIVIGLCLFIIYFWKNSYYLILKLVGGLEEKTEKV